MHLASSDRPVWFKYMWLYICKSKYRARQSLSSVAHECQGFWDKFLSLLLSPHMAGRPQDHTSSFWKRRKGGVFVSLIHFSRGLIQLFITSVPGLSLSFWRFPVILGIPWLVDASFYSLSLSSHGLLPLCPNSPLLRKTSIIWWASTLHYDLIMSWLHLQRPYFKINSYSQAPEFKPWPCLFGGTIKSWKRISFS